MGDALSGFIRFAEGGAGRRGLREELAIISPDALDDGVLEGELGYFLG